MKRPLRQLLQTKSWPPCQPTPTRSPFFRSVTSNAPPGLETWTALIIFGMTAPAPDVRRWLCTCPYHGHLRGAILESGWCSHRRFPTSYEHQTALTDGSDLRPLESGLAGSLPKVFGMITTLPDAQHAKQMTERPFRRGAEVDGQEAATRPQHPPCLGEPPTFQVVR